MSGKSARSEADDATRGSAIKLAAEVASRLFTFATTALLGHALGVADFGRYTQLSVYAVLLAELGELGLQNLASRALVAGTHALRSLLRARLLLLALVTAAALAAVPLAPALASRLGGVAPDGVALALLVSWLALSGWGEFAGIALRCRGARRGEALLLLVLRGAGLLFVSGALASGARLRGVALALAVSPLPALALAALLLRRSPDPHPGAAHAPLAVLRESAPLGVYGGLLLLSPRVEFLVLSWLAPAAEYGLFAAGLLVVWPLAMVPSAVVAGAMPALTREALKGDGAVRERTAATAGALAAPAAIGLALVAPALVLVLGSGYAAAAGPLRLMAAALPAAFLNALVAGALIAAGRAAWLPRLTAARVVLAFALAFVLVPRLGAIGAAAGLVCAEWAQLGAGALACRRARFPIPASGPIAWGLVACIPMALAVSGLSAHLALAVGVGALTWAATLAAAARLAPSRVRQLTGDLRYPWTP